MKMVALNASKTIKLTNKELVQFMILTALLKIFTENVSDAMMDTI